MNNVLQHLNYWMRQGLGTPLMLIVMLGMMMLPLPPFLLDIFFTFNIALSLVVLLAVIYSERPLDFAVFPTVILLATLLRLALNVASTRVVLLNGHNGTLDFGLIRGRRGKTAVSKKNNYMKKFDQLDEFIRLK